jgi:hypothetical protein
MNIAQSSAEFLSGLQKIERAIIEAARARGRQLTAGHFVWNRGRDLVPPPEAIPLEIRFQGATANAVLSREQVEDSHDRIDRADVLELVRAITDRLYA